MSQDQVFPGPSRKSLLVGAMLVALHGLQQETIAEARKWGYADWNEYADYARVRAAIDAVRHNRRHETSDHRILDLMAHTCQTLRVNHEEWENVQLIFPAQQEAAAAQPV